MRYRLRTLLIMQGLGPVMLAGAWFGWQRYLAYKREHEFDQLIELITTTITVESGWDEPAQKASPDEN